MAIELISKIKPKNNGNFKLVDAQDVEYNGKGLDEAIASGEFKGDKGDRGDIGPMGPTGPTGPKGDNGNDGFSPTVSVAEDVDGITVTVQNKDGAQTAKVKNGKDGKDYEHSEEFKTLAEQVRADKESVEQSKTSVEQTVAQAEGKIDTAGTIAIQGVQNEGTTQTEKVTVEGTKQLTDIQSKGEEILHSFPQDFPTQMATKLDKHHGAENAGKVIAVNEEGNATPLCPNGVRYNPETNNLEYGSDDLPLMEGIKLDDSLTKEGFAADAKVVGDKFDSKLNKQQGVENVGKTVVVGEDGNLVVGDVQSGGGTNDCADAIVNTASGESPLVVTDSSNRIIKDLKLFGKTEQVQTTGKNLFDIETCPLEHNNTSFKIPISSGDVLLMSGYTFAENTQYTLSVSKVISENNNSASFKFDYTDRTRSEVLVKDMPKKSLTSTSGKTIKSVYIINPYGGSHEVFNLQVEEGSTAKPYEPYTGGKPSPSPDHPQEIKSVGKWNESTQKYEVEVVLSGKNLLDITACEDGKVLNSYGNIINSANGFLTDFIPCFANSPYCRSNKSFTIISFYDRDKNFIGCINQYNDEFITPDECRYFRFSINKQDVDYTKAVANVGTALMDYEPYKKPQTLTLTSDRPITKLDKLVEQGGEIGWLYQSKIVSLTGEEEWKSSLNAFYTTTYNFIKNNEAKCSHYVLAGITNLEKNNIFSIGDGSYMNSLWIRDTRFSAVQDFKVHLSDLNEKGTPIMVVSSAAQTEFIPLPQEEQNAIRALKTYNPTTVITTDGGELDPDVEVTYTADTKNYIDNKFAQLQKSLVNTQVQLL